VNARLANLAEVSGRKSGDSTWKVTGIWAFRAAGARFCLFCHIFLQRPRLVNSADHENTRGLDLQSASFIQKDGQNGPPRNYGPFRTYHRPIT